MHASIFGLECRVFSIVDKCLLCTMQDFDWILTLALNSSSASNIPQQIASVQKEQNASGLDNSMPLGPFFCRSRGKMRVSENKEPQILNLDNYSVQGYNLNPTSR